MEGRVAVAGVVGHAQVIKDQANVAGETLDGGGQLVVPRAQGMVEATRIGALRMTVVLGTR